MSDNTELLIDKLKRWLEHSDPQLLNEIAAFDPVDLMELRGVAKVRAGKIIESARTLLGLYRILGVEMSVAAAEKEPEPEKSKKKKKKGKKDKKKKKKKKKK